MEGAWVAQSVKHLILGFSLGHDLMVHEIESHVRSCVDSMEPAWSSLSLCRLLLHMLSLSLSQIHFKEMRYNGVTFKISINIFILYESKGQKIKISPENIYYPWLWLHKGLNLYCPSLKVLWILPKHTLHLLSSNQYTSELSIFTF